MTDQWRVCKKKVKSTNEHTLRNRKTIKINFYLEKSLVNRKEKIHINQNKIGVNPEDANPLSDKTSAANKKAGDKTIDSSSDKFWNNTVGILQDHIEARIKEMWS